MKLIFFSLLIFISAVLNAQSSIPTKYLVEIDSMHRQFNFLQTFNIQPITKDTVIIKHTQSIHLNDSLNNMITALENEIDNAVFHRISRDSIINGSWELVSVRIFINSYPCCSESWEFNEIHFINPKSTSFSTPYISDIISKFPCRISASEQFVQISRYYGFVMNDSEEGGATYIFKKKKGY